MINKERHNELINKLENKSILIEDDSIYFIGKCNFYLGVSFDVLCRVKVKTKTQYILNQEQNIVTDNINMFNEYIEKKSAGVRGYKTIKMGIIENYYYLDMLEWANKGGDIDGFYWWTDRERKVKISDDIINQIRQYINNLSSEFKKVA
jgi:hypothetical protein